MSKIKYFLILIALPTVLYSQNDSLVRDTTFWKTKFYIVPQQFASDFTISDAENCLRKFKSKASDYSIWIAFYKSDPKKVAFIGWVDCKVYRSILGYQTKKMIYTEGHIFAFSTLTSKDKKAFGIYQEYKEYIDCLNGEKKSFAEYYRNGKIKCIGMYDKNGKQDKKWKYYDESGKLVKTVKYRNGEVVN